MGKSKSPNHSDYRSPITGDRLPITRSPGHPITPSLCHSVTISLLCFLLSALCPLPPVSAAGPQFSQGKPATGQPAGIFAPLEGKTTYQFSFKVDKSTFQMVYADGKAIETEDVYTAYLSSAMHIYCAGEEYVLSNGLKPVGAYLSGSDWDNRDIPAADEVAIDPKIGRFKFRLTGWNEPEDIAQATYQQVNPRLKSFEDKAIAVYGGRLLTPGRPWHVYTQLYSDHGWQSEVQVSVDTITLSEGPEQQITFDSSGNAVCVWAGDEGLCFSKLLAGTTTWQPPQPISDTAGASFLRLASGGNRTICVFRVEYNLYAREYDGTNWGENMPISGLGGGNERGASAIDFDLAGQAYCVFKKYDGSPLYFKKLAPGTTTWSDEREISETTGVSQPDLAWNNTAVVPYGICVFEQNSRVWAVKIIGEACQDKESVDLATGTLVNGSTVYGAMQPAVAFDQNNNAEIVYVQQFGGFGVERNVYFNKYSYTEQKWGTPRAIDDSLLVAQPQICFAGGKGICICSQGTPQRVKAWIYDIGNAPEGEVTVDYFYRPETEPPSRVADLTGLAGEEGGTIEISFTAPGDDGTVGTADHYVVKYSTREELHWTVSDAWEEYLQNWSPKPYGEEENFILYQLTKFTTYWVAVKGVDEWGNEGTWPVYPIRVWVVEDVTFPTFSKLTGFPPGGETNQPSLLITGTLSEGNCKLTIFNNATLISSGTVVGQEFRRKVPLELGQNCIKLICKDKAGHETEETRTIIYSIATGSVSNTIVYPNPCKQDRLFFGRLPEKATIRIYNVAGELVRELEKDDYTDTKEWGLDNDAEQKVASGVYIWLVTDGNGGKKLGKLAVVR